MAVEKAFPTHVLGGLWDSDIDTDVTAAPSFVCFDELIMLITSDNEHVQMWVFVLSVKAALTESQDLSEAGSGSP
ncbi:hypothetical protein Nmel_005308 [Mimus melanotis]